MSSKKAPKGGHKEKIKNVKPKRPAESVGGVPALPIGMRQGAVLEVQMDGMGDAETALSRLAKKGMDSGMMRDWTFRSPLAPGTNKYEKPTQFRQRQARKGLWNYRQNSLLAIVRTVLFKKVRS